MQIVTRPPPLPDRPADANKVSAGRVLIVGGSRAMAGAPALAALGAHRAGAGLVRLAVPASIQPTVASFRPESTTSALPDSGQGALGAEAKEALLAAVVDWDAVVLGPGLGRKEGTLDLIRSFTLAMALPLVLDADALYAWNTRGPELRARKETTLLTPHEGEAGRLLGISSGDVRRDRQAAALRLAHRFAAVVVLKGPRTLVTDGGHVYVNASGGPALATGGTGDVLAGVLAALLAEKSVSPFEAACIGVHAHGAAADAVAGSRDRGLLASELAGGLPDVLAGMRRGATS